jgi:cysteine desulfurase
VFTSGATESIEVALAHATQHRRNADQPMRVLSTPVEHSALLDLLTSGSRDGQFQVRWLPVDDRGRLDVGDLERALSAGVDLICVMAANNEVGNVYPIADVGRCASRHGAPLLVDATQAAGRVPLAAEAWGLTYVAASAHKMYGPKGVGALIALTATLPSRRGTPNVPGIAAFGEAARLRLSEMDIDEPRIAGLRDRLQQLLLERVPDLRVNGDLRHRLACSLHVSAVGAPNDAVLARLHDSVAMSSGAACSRGALQTSHVLQAMRLPNDVQEGALRMATGKFTTEEEVDIAAELIADAIRSVRLDLGLAA